MHDGSSTRAFDPFTSATDLAAQIRSGALSPVEALEASLERMDRLNPELNAVEWRDDDAARADALDVERRITAGEDVGPFAGVPTLVKDLTKARGQPATFGSFGAPDGVADEDELVIAAMRRAGFVLCGRSNAPEFGPLPVTENTRYGITRNPWDTVRTPGGSSGGSAAAVASGIVPLAHGNDGGGSIRIPASCCGLVGLKPSRWRVPSTTPGWFGMSVEGALCRTVRDAAAVLDCLSVPDALTWEQAPPPGRPFTTEVGADPGRLRVALQTVSALGVEVEAPCRAAVEDAGRLLEELGHHVEVLDEDPFDPAAIGPFLNVVNSSYGGYEDIDWDRVEPHNKAWRAAGAQVDSLALVSSLNALRRMTRPVAARWGRDFDVLVTPTIAIEPPIAGEVLAEAHAQPSAPPLAAVVMVAFTAPYNMTGQPAVSLPLAQAPSGLPVGVQLVGAPWGEGALIRLASQLEAAEPWEDRHPPMAIAEDAEEAEEASR
ncbi:MAG: amidase [Actinomycetota bacterium]|nr:amidase [Actinomycetota bacterium]